MGYKQEDKTNIIKVVKNKGENYEEFNCRVSRYIRRWIYDVLLKRAGKENTLSHRISLNLEQAGSLTSLLHYHSKLTWLLRRCEDKMEEYVRQRHTSEMDDNKAIYANNVATLYYFEERYDEVLVLLNEILDYHSARMDGQKDQNIDDERMREEIRKHRKLACNAVFDIACVYRKQHMYAEAARHFEMALEGYMQLRERILAMNAVHHMGLLLIEDFAQLEAAEAMFENALEEKEKLLGDTHLSTIDTAYCLACILHEKKEYGTALRLFNRAKRARAQFFGPDDMVTLTTAKLTQQCDEKVRSMMFLNQQLSQVSISPSGKIGAIRMGLPRSGNSGDGTSSHSNANRSVTNLESKDGGSDFPSISVTSDVAPIVPVSASKI